jgi:NAD(P)H-flavin reductase
VSKTERIARVVARRTLSSRVNELELEIAGTPSFRWSAGQYLTLHPEGGTGAHEGPLAYSIASAWDGREPPRLALAIGPGSGADVLADIGPGAELAIDGPFGAFTLPRAAGALLVGGGTGVAPLRAQASEWLDREGDEPLVLVVGARSESDLLWHDEFVARARDSRRFRYVPVLSQPSAGWSGRTGWVQAHLPELVASLPRTAVARVCGAKPLVESCLSLLQSLGLASANLEAESY